VRVRATDDVGNTEAASSRTFDFDATEPETSIDSVQPDPTNSPNASFDFSSNEPGSSFECAIDGGAWTACTSPKAYLGLSDGSHSFDVRATDTAGNTDGNPASVFWTVDTTAPSSTATFPTASGSYTTAEWNAGCATVGLCGSHSDSGSGVAEVEVSVRQGTGNYWDGDSFDATSETYVTASHAGGNWSLAFSMANFPADGQYTVHVRATDDAGNYWNVSASLFFSSFFGSTPGTLATASKSGQTPRSSCSIGAGSSKETDMESSSDFILAHRALLVCAGVGEASWAASLAPC